MATLARLDVILGLQMQGFNRALDRAQRKLRTMGRKLDQTGRTLSTRVTVPLAAAGAAAVKMRVDFESSMTRIQSLVGHSSEQVAEWSDQLLELGPKVGKGPKELADAMFFITSAGLEGNAALEALTASAQASAAGLGETQIVADAVTSAMNAYGQANLDAAQATSVLVATVKEGKAGAEEIAPVLGRLLPVASELGVEFHEVGAAIAAMTRVGAKADEAATSLKSLMVGIIKPASQSREQIEAMGLSVDQLRKVVKEKGVLAALSLLAEKMEGNLDALGKVFPNQRALTAVLNATGAAAEETAGIYERMAKVTKETLAESFRVAAETAEFSLNAALARLQVTLVRLGDAILPKILPIVDNLGKALEAAGKAFSELDESTQGFILGLAAIATILGPLLVTFGVIATFVGTLSAGFIGWTAVVVAGAVLVVKHWDQVKAAVASFVEFATPALEKFRELLSTLWERVKESAVRIWPDVKRIFQNVVDAMVGLWIEHGDTIKKAWEITKRVIVTGLDVVLGAIEAIAAFLAGDASRAWKILSDTAKKAFDTMSKIAGAALLNLQAEFLDLESTALKALNRIITKVASLAVAFLQLPFIDPVTRAAGNKGLEVLGTLMAGIATEAGDASTKADGLRAAADALVKPLEAAKEKMVEMQGPWVEVKGAIIDTGETAVAVFDSAGNEINRKLKGGFSKGVAEGVEEGKREVAEFLAYLATLSLRFNVDTEWIQRQLAEAGLKPDTSGSLGA